MNRAAATIAPSRGETTDPVVGQTVLGRYRVVKPLAKGGMGVVYLGRTEGAAGFARPVVIKRVLPKLLADPDIARMFVREAKILSNLHHPGIVGVLDFGKEDDAYVMVLDYVHGYDAAAWLKHVKRSGRSVPLDVALHITIRLLEALHYAHTLKRADGTAMPVVHRDVSPGNVLLDTEGHVRVLDFGIARIARQATGEENPEDSEDYRTQETTFKGKLSYAHPSLLAHEEPSAQTDVYSAAVVLFQMLVGHNPFRGGTPAQTLNKVANLPLPKLRDFVSDASPELEAVLLKAMSRELEQGYASAAELAEALRELRPDSETDVVARMSALLSEDFMGDMPNALDLEALDVRDAAWRTSVIDLDVGQLQSTPPPPAPPAGFSFPSDLDDLAEETLRGDSLTSIGETTHITKTQRDSHRGMIIATSAVAVALIAVAAALVFKQESVTSQQQRYLVVSKDPAAASGSTASALGSTTTTPNADATSQTGTSAPSASPKEGAPQQPTVSDTEARQPDARRSAASKPEPKLLTQRFSIHQSRIQACFAGNPTQTKSTPNVQIAFEVSPSGKVQSASLIPSSVSGTKLGSCLLRVARGARFGTLTESVAFRIPVQARLK